MFLYRLTPTKYASDTSGEGAKRKGGRWNPPGLPIHYTSSSAALAVLEYLIHLDPSDLPPMSMVTYEIPDEKIVNCTETLPKNWKESPPPKKLAEIGKKWLESKSSLALSVPTVLFPHGPESNILINPLHPDFSEMRTLKTEIFEFDQRLLEK